MLNKYFLERFNEDRNMYYFKYIKQNFKDKVGHFQLAKMISYFLSIYQSAERYLKPDFVILK